MNIDIETLDRRRFLRGSAVALALPWLESFSAGIEELPEIVEAYRTSGEIDYTLKVVVPSIEEYDDFYKRLIAKVDLYDVRTVFVMEQMKHTTALPLDYLD